MSKYIKLLSASLLALSTSYANAGFVEFFGEDTSTAGISLGPNASAARADFLSNLTGVGNEDFESFAVGQSAPLALSFPGSSGTLGATINGTGGISQDGPGRFATSGSNFWETSTGSFSIVFDTPISAFGFNGIDIGDFVTAQMTLELEGGATQTVTVDHSLGLGNNDNATLFYGFINDENTYTSITFNNVGGGDTFAFDDMIIGDVDQVTTGPKPVSEPGTIALFGLVLAGLGVARKKRA